MNQTTIAAISTPIGTGGICIVKISGKKASKIASKIFRASPGFQRRNHRDRAVMMKSHRLYHGYIQDPKEGNPIDEVLVSFMKAPHSYTGEDVVEINSHSGSLVSQLVLNLVLNNGAVLAEPGEFTKRAFLNGRIDLTQAEAVTDIINSKSKDAVTAAVSNLKGHFKQEIYKIKDAIEELMVQIAAQIDFPEEIEETISLTQSVPKIDQTVIQKLQYMLDSYESQKIFRDGISMAIIGRPNVGKSSLLNRLLGKNRAIVTDIPGTTRDAIKDTFYIKGIPVEVTDTAGIQKTGNPVEALGIQKTEESMLSADLLIFMIDSNKAIDSRDHQIYHRIKDRRAIIVFNKIDLVEDRGRLNPPEEWKKKQVYISALYGHGVERLKAEIKAVFGSCKGTSNPGGVIGNLRQKGAVQNCLKAAIRVKQGLVSGSGAELISVDAQACLEELETITGEGSKNDILDAIFERFCVGK